MYFRNYRLRKMSLEKCLKGAVSEHPLTVNMLQSPKDLKNMYGSSFIILFHHSLRNRVGKCRC